MFELNEQAKEQSETLYAMTGNMGRGDILFNSQIEEVLGVSPNTGHWKLTLDHVRRRLRKERGIAMWPVASVGMRLCTVEQQINLGSVRLRRAMRQQTKGIIEVSALPTNGLTLMQSRRREAQLEISRRVNKSMTASLNESKAIFRPTTTNYFPSPRIASPSDQA